MKKTALILCLLTLALSFISSTAYYDVGSQNFTISIGTNVPLLASSYSSTDSGDTTLVTGIGPGSGGNSTNFTMGGYGSIDYEVFLHPLFSVGGELGYQFNFVADGKIFTQVPFMFKATYMPLQGTFELPISLGLGMNYLSYNDNAHLALLATFNVGGRYFFNESWGLGLTSGITYSAELYLEEPKMNGQLTFVPINVTITYRH